jgi:hypothetical protein
METIAIAQVSAYTHVTTVFVSACEEKKVDPLAAWLAIGRLMNFSPPASNAPSSGPSLSKQSLTKEEKEAAKRAAIAEKARKHNLNAREINLSAPELKKAWADAQRKKDLGEAPIVASQGPLPSNPKADPARDKLEPKATIPKVKNSSPPVKKPEAPKVDQATLLLRRQSKQRLDNFRGRALKMLPTVVVSPTNLHLLAYQNFYLRLREEWDTFQASFDLKDTGGVVQDPLRGLPDLDFIKESKLILDDARRVLKEQNNLKGSFLLTTDDGLSFWDRDEPSEACPPEIARPVPDETLDAISAEILALVGSK